MIPSIDFGLVKNARMQGARIRQRSEEVMKSGRSEWMQFFIRFSYPLFLTSALPIFTALMLEDGCKAPRDNRHVGALNPFGYQSL
jgi:hypothetical protein